MEAEPTQHVSAEAAELKPKPIPAHIKREMDAKQQEIALLERDCPWWTRNHPDYEVRFQRMSASQIHNEWEKEMRPIRQRREAVKRATRAIKSKGVDTQGHWLYLNPKWNEIEAWLTAAEELGWKVYALLPAVNSAHCNLVCRRDKPLGQDEPPAKKGKKK